MGNGQLVMGNDFSKAIMVWPCKKQSVEVCYRRNVMVIIQATDEGLMIRLTYAYNRLRSRAMSAFGALLCLCFFLGAHQDGASKAASTQGFSGSHKPETQSINSSPWESKKPIAVNAQAAIRVAICANHSPNLPPERFSGLSLSSLSSTLNNPTNLRSRIFVLPLHDRAPPHFG